MGLLGGTGSNRRSWADHAGGGFPVSAPAGGSAGLTERVVITLSGVRQPIVAILLLISFFTVLSGKPVDGLLLFTVACALAWDAGMRSRQAAPPCPSPRRRGHPHDAHAGPRRPPVRRGRRARPPARADARRPRRRSLDAAAVPAARGPVHRRLLRPSLQRAVGRAASHVDDLGEPDRRRRRAPRGARVREMGGAGPLVRGQGGPGVRAAVPAEPVAP